MTKSKLVNKCGLDEKIKILTIKEEIKTLAAMAELKAEEDKIVKLETHGLSYFLGKKFLGDDDSQNMFIYQQTLNTLELKKARVLIMFLVGDQRGHIFLNLDNYMLLFLHSIRLSEYKVITKFDKDPLAVD